MAECESDEAGYGKRRQGTAGTSVAVRMELAEQCEKGNFNAQKCVVGVREWQGVADWDRVRLLHPPCTYTETYLMTHVV